MQLPPEFGVGLVNTQAAEITSFVYPEWTAPELHWTIGSKVGQDEHGYDLYDLTRGDEQITVPANRLVFMARLTEAMAHGQDVSS